MKINGLIKDNPDYIVELDKINFLTETDNDIKQFCIWLSRADLTIVSFRCRRGVWSQGLDLSSLKPKIIIDIFTAIVANPKITELDLSRCNLYGIRNRETLETIYSILNQKKFTSVNVADNKLSSAFLDQLILWASLCTEKLYLSKNLLGSASFDNLAQLLQAVHANENLCELHLDSCELDRALYADRLMYQDAFPNLSLEELENLMLTEQANMESLWEDFVCATSLSRLNICGNGFNTEFVERLVALASQKNPGLQIIYPKCQYITSASEAILESDVADPDVTRAVTVSASALARGAVCFPAMGLLGDSMQDPNQYAMPLVPAVAAAADRLSTGSSSTQQASSIIASDTDSGTVAATMLFSKMAVEFAAGAGWAMDQDDVVSQPVLTKPSSPRIHG